MNILIVEDEKTLADNLKIGLEFEHYTVEIFYNGLDALNRIMKGAEFDLMIFDVMMPKLDGFSLCKKLRDSDILTPILFLSAKDMIQDKVHGLNIGADDYIVKPFSFDELLARINSIIRRNSSIEEKIVIDSLVIFPQKNIVYRAKKEIILTGKEYTMLHYFMKHPNIILTKQQIIENVWDFAYDPSSNLVEVFIKRLRKKVDKDFPQEKRLFSNIRGVGYKIE